MVVVVIVVILVLQLMAKVADDFIDRITNDAALLTKHRKAPTIEVKDVQLILGKYSAQ